MGGRDKGNTFYFGGTFRKAKYEIRRRRKNRNRKARAGNVTLFAFDAGQELSEHAAPYDALVHILDGEAEVRISGVSYSLAAGDAILMPANEPHALKATKQFKMLLTMVRT